jgi:4-amino-4-deoxy-L-arabinose transferase-like glycosyltransferase
LAAVTIVLDPRRELLTWDDGWAYARTVATLVDSGHYALDAWSVANMPVQVGLAALLSEIFGYSLVLLRLVTMALLVVLVLSFRRLAQAAGSPPRQAVVLSLGLLASPVLLMLSFTFMSDVQFLAWLVLALTLYERGLRRGGAALIVAGSIAAACAIGTRQVGVAILAGWFTVLLLSRSDERPPLRTFVLALALPAAMSAWQLWVGAGEPNFTQAYRLAEQRVFFSRPVPALGKEAIWRAAIWIQYSALYLLPLAPLVVGAGLARFRASTAGVRFRALVLTLLVTGFVAFGLALNSGLTVRPEPSPTDLPWPALGLIWMLPVQPWATPIVERLLDLAGFLIVVPLCWLAFSRGKLLPERRPSPAVLLVAGTGAALFLVLFIYVQLNDTYVVTLLPFTLLALAVAMRGIEPGRFWMAATIGWSLVMIFAVTGLTARAYDAQQVVWDEADRAAIGKPYACVAGPKHWAEYHGAFDDWIAAGAPGLRPAPRRFRIGEDPFHDPFYAWLKQRDQVSPACP